MSLTIAFKSAQLGLSQTEKKIAVVASNINNADRAGYTRKVLSTTYMFNGTISLPVGGKVVSAIANPQLVKQVVSQITSASYERTLSTTLSKYSQSFGSTAKDAANLQSTMSDLMGVLQILEANPGDNASKSKVVTSAQQIASSLNSLTQSIQSQRLQANNDISNSVGNINEQLKIIADLNKQISAADASGQTTADLEDERNTALQSLSKEIGIQYFINDRNQAMVYSTGGPSLVSGSGYSQINYNPVGVVTPSTVYPGGFAPIDLNGVDITSSLHTGNLGALIQLRDTVLPKEQEKLDMFANTLQTTVNAVLNKGATYPPLQAITGTTTVTAATAFSGTGNLRVAVTDVTGALTNYADIDLTTVTTVGGLITALNAIPGVNASINADGKLVVGATGTGRISMNPLNSDVGGVSATQFFGFNNLFVNDSTGAATINVNPNLIANFDELAVGTLSSAAAPVAGDYVLTQGDVSTTKALVDMLKSAQSFGAAGSFSARNSTLGAYAGAIISDVANQAAAADNKATIAEASYNYLATNLANESGVNIDEETANLTTLQTAYQANAQIMATVKELFQTLIDSVR